MLKLQLLLIQSFFLLIHFVNVICVNVHLNKIVMRELSLRGNTRDAIKPYAINEKLMANTRIARLRVQLLRDKRPEQDRIIQRESLAGENAETPFPRRGMEVLKQKCTIIRRHWRVADVARFASVDNVGGKMSKTSTVGKQTLVSRDERELLGRDGERLATDKKRRHRCAIGTRRFLNERHPRARQKARQMSVE